MTEKKDREETSRKGRKKNPPQKDQCSEEIQREDSKKV